MSPFPRIAALVAALTLANAAPRASATDWPQFRGPHASGVAPGGFPVRFGPDTNVVWKVPVPGGNSSPTLLGPLVFLTGFADNQLLVLAHSRADGHPL